MTDHRTISLCLTNYNRCEMLVQSFEKIMKDERVSEIIIVDDRSDIDIYNRIRDVLWTYTGKKPRIKLFRNEQNLGCYRNKREVISKAENDFVIIFDSDNVIDTSYIDKIFECGWHPQIILAPDFARPHFDYRSFATQTITKENVSKFVDQKHFTAMINTMNYFVNRDEYLKVWEDVSEPWTADTALQNYNWLNAGNKIHVLDGLQYDHRIEHTEHRSHYQEHNKKTGDQFNKIMAKMRALK